MDTAKAVIFAALAVLLAFLVAPFITRAMGTRAGLP